MVYYLMLQPVSFEHTGSPFCFMQLEGEEKLSQAKGSGIEASLVAPDTLKQLLEVACALLPLW